MPNHSLAGCCLAGTVYQIQPVSRFGVGEWPIAPGTGRNVPGTIAVSCVHQETLVAGRGSEVATLLGCARARNQRTTVLNTCLVRRLPLLCLSKRSVRASSSSSCCLITARWVTSTQFLIIRFPFRSGCLFTDASPSYTQILTKYVINANECSRALGCEKRDPQCYPLRSRASRRLCVRDIGPVSRD